MFTKKEIDLQMKSPSFEREYNLKFLEQTGNVFHYQDKVAAIEEYDLQLYTNLPIL
jgi:hypothetical protein